MEAAWYEKRGDGTVACRLCPNDCIIAEGHAGACRVRTNRGGVLVADSWGEVVSMAIDPIEKKPLYHFHPGRPILSVGPNGCNFRCGFCQNAGISQGTVPTVHVAPEELAAAAGREGSIGVAYTYAEPFIWFEYIRDAGRLVHEQGLANVLVTNGYVRAEPLAEILPLIDAMNVDVKSMKPAFYREVCGGRLGDVLGTVERAAGACHLEVTNLIIPGYNDTEEDFTLLADWLAGVDPGIPLHVSRYFPHHEFSALPTPPETIERACDIARAKLRHVYAGNIALEGGSDTRCPACGATLVSRSYYRTAVTGIRDGACASCGVPSGVVGA